MKERESNVRIEVQEYAPRLEPAAPIRLADRNHARSPSRHCTILEVCWKSVIEPSIFENGALA